MTDPPLHGLDTQQDIEHFQANPTPQDLNGPVEENPEYSLIVSANNISVEIENELLIVHKVRPPLALLPSLPTHRRP